MRRPHIRGAKPPNANIARAAPYGRGMPRPYAPACRRTNFQLRAEQGSSYDKFSASHKRRMSIIRLISSNSYFFII